MISSTSNGRAPTKDIGEGARGGRGSGKLRFPSFRVVLRIAMIWVWSECVPEGSQAGNLVPTVAMSKGSEVFTRKSLT